MPKQSRISGAAASGAAFGGGNIAAAALAADSRSVADASFGDSAQLDTEASSSLKRAQKRDSTTRCRALESLFNRLQQLDVESRVQLLPAFLFVWRKLQFDDSKQCRILVCKCAGAICDGLNKKLAPYVKQTMRIWMLCLHDIESDVAATAAQALERAFPNAEKRNKAKFSCADEACDAVLGCLSLSSAKDVQEEGMSKEEAGSRLERMHVAAIASTTTFATAGAASSVQSVMDSTSCLKRFFNHSSTAVRNASIRALRSAVEYEIIPKVSHDETFAPGDDGYCSQLQERLGYLFENEDDPTCVPEVLAFAVALAKRISKNEAALKPAVEESLIRCIKRSLVYCSEAASPLLLPITACVRPQIRKRLIQAMWSAVSSTVNDLAGRRALADGTCEACAYSIYCHPSNEMVSDVLFATIGRNALASKHDSPAFARAIARVASSQYLPVDVWQCVVDGMQRLLQQEATSSATFFASLQSESRSRNLLPDFIEQAIIKPAVSNLEHISFSSTVVNVFPDDIVARGHATTVLTKLKEAFFSADSSSMESFASMAASLLSVGPDDLRREFFTQPAPHDMFIRSILVQLETQQSLYSQSPAACDALDEILLTRARENLEGNGSASESVHLLQVAFPTHMSNLAAIGKLLELMKDHLANSESNDALQIVRDGLPKIKPDTATDAKLSCLEEIFALRLLDSNMLVNDVWDNHLCPSITSGSSLSHSEYVRFLPKVAVCIRAAAIVSEVPEVLGSAWRAIVAGDSESCYYDSYVLAPLDNVWPACVTPPPEAHSAIPQEDISEDEIEDRQLALSNMCCIAAKLSETAQKPYIWTMAEACASGQQLTRAIFGNSEKFLPDDAAVSFLRALCEEDLDESLSWVLESGLCTSNSIICFLRQHVLHWSPRDQRVLDLAEAVLPTVSKTLRRLEEVPSEMVEVSMLWLKAGAELLSNGRGQNMAQIVRIAASTLHVDRSKGGVTESEKVACIEAWEGGCKAWAQHMARAAALARVAESSKPQSDTDFDVALAALAGATVEIAASSLSIAHWQPLMQMLETWIERLLPRVEDAVEREQEDNFKESNSGDLDSDGVVTLSQLALLVVETIEHLPIEIAEPNKDGLYGDIVPYSSVVTGRHIAHALAAAGWLSTRTSVLKAAYRLLLCAGVLQTRKNGLLEDSGLGTSFWCCLARTCTSKSSPQTVLLAAEEFEQWEEIGMPAVHALYALLVPESAASDPQRSLQHAACASLHCNTIIEASVMGLDASLENLRELQNATDQLHQEQEFDSDTGEQSAETETSQSSAAELACVREPLRILIEDSTERKQALTPGEMLAWGVLASYVSSLPIDNKWRPRLTRFVAEARSLPRVLDILMNKLPLPSSAAVRKAEHDVSCAWEGAREPVNQLMCMVPASEIAEHLGWQGLSAEQMVALWTMLLRAFPAGVRSWFAQKRDKKRNAKLEAMTASHISQRMIEDEIFKATSAQDLKQHQLEQSNMHLKPNRRAGEMVAQYSVDESVLELTISLPQAYPLKPPEVSVTRSVGISDSRLRQWQITMSGLLRNQDGAIAAALRLWLRNVTKEFEGVEACPICYSVVHTTSGRLPRKECKRCKQRFHAACLLHWFSSSGRSDCPLCRYQMT